MLQHFRHLYSLFENSILDKFVNVFLLTQKLQQVLLWAKNFITLKMSNSRLY